MSQSPNHLQFPSAPAEAASKTTITRPENLAPHSPVPSWRTPKLSLGESFRGSLLPKLWAEIREKSHSELSLVLEVVRGSPSSTEIPLSDQLTPSSAGAASPTTKKPHRNRAIWERYTPNHLNRQLHLGM
uniref:Uncharacterized protein n=1 Tax=Ascaris lumbricoides TaxID=6252 RepID=A0A0M3IIY0_ASCLU